MASKIATFRALIRAKVVMFSIKPKIMKCRFELTYLKTIKPQVVRFGIKLKVMKFSFVLTYF
jgi:hypothetical protein